MIETQHAIDLGKLAVDRVEKALQSVFQLMDGPSPYSYAILIVIIARLVRVAAKDLADGMEAQNGKRPTDDEALNHTIAELFDDLGIKYKVLDVKKFNQATKHR